MYAQMDANGFVHVIVGRSEGKIVGWYVMTIIVNGHYADAGLMAFTDMYFVMPEFRKGNAGLRLFQTAIDYAKGRGCVKFYTSHKLHRDRSSMMKLLGFKATDMIYSRVL
jgi:GNAT superfamily N-acetyltransferase